MSQRWGTGRIPGASGFGKAPHPVYPWEERSKLQPSVLYLKRVIRNFDWRLETSESGENLRYKALSFITLKCTKMPLVLPSETND